MKGGNLVDCIIRALKGSQLLKRAYYLEVCAMVDQSSKGFQKFSLGLEGITGVQKGLLELTGAQKRSYGSKALTVAHRGLKEGN